MAGSRFSIEAVISMIDRVSKPMQDANRSVSMFSRNSQRHFGGVGAAASSAIGFLGVAGGAGLIYVGMKKIVGEAMNMESSVANFTTLLGGSSAEAQKLVNRLQVMGASTPFEFKDLAAMTQVLLPSMNGDINAVIKTLGMLGDTAGGNAQKLESITRGYNKAMMKGKVDMESLNMIAEAGVPIHGELAKSMGFGKNQMTAYFKKISSGAVSTSELTKAFEKMTTGTGRFAGGMKRSSETTAGLWSTFQDSISMTAGAIGQELLPTFRDILTSLTDLSTKVLLWVQNNKDGIAKMVEDVKSFLKTLWSLRYVIMFVVGAFYAYRLALILTKAASVGLTVATKALALASLGLKAFNAVKILGFAGALKYAFAGTKALAAAQWLLNAAMLANPIGLIIAAILLLIGLTIVAVRNWDTFGAALTALMGPLGTIISLFKTVYDRWNDITTAFQTGGMLQGIIMIGKVIMDSILYPIQQLLQIIGKIPGMGFAASAASSIQGFRENSLGAKPVSAPAGTKGFASPQSTSMASGVSTQSNLDINVRAPKGTTEVSATGLTRGMRLNQGAQ